MNLRPAQPADVELTGINMHSHGFHFLETPEAYNYSHKRTKNRYNRGPVR